MGKKWTIEELMSEDFGKLKVLRFGEVRFTKKGKPVRQVVVKCRCGKEKMIDLCNLLSGNTTSCGCEKRRNNGEDGVHEAQHR